MVVCLEQGADLHVVQLMPLPLTVSCFSKIQIGFTFLVLAHLGSPGKRAVKRARVCVIVYFSDCSPVIQLDERGKSLITLVSFIQLILTSYESISMVNLDLS